MILKASQRGGASALASHLLNAEDNEHVELHQIEGFIASDLRGAFKETKALALGTRCTQPFFHVSMSPPENARVPVDAFERAASKIIERMGLEGQPRALVFHEKEGRRHAHLVVGRINAETMTARPLSHFKLKLTDLSRELYLEHGWSLPKGLQRNGERRVESLTLAEWQQAKRQTRDPTFLREMVRDCWAKSDSADSFRKALVRSATAPSALNWCLRNSASVEVCRTASSERESITGTSCADSIPTSTANAATRRGVHPRLTASASRTDPTTPPLPVQASPQRGLPIERFAVRL